MFRLAKKILIALLLAGLVVGLLPVKGIVADVKKITELFPLTIKVKDVVEVWRSAQANEQYGVFDQGDKIVFIGSGVLPNTTLPFCFTDYYDVIKTNAGTFVLAYRDRSDLGTVSLGGIENVTEIIVPKTYFKRETPKNASGYSSIGHGFGESAAPRDFDLNTLLTLGLGSAPDSGCLWKNEMYFFNPQAKITIDQAANWLGLIYGSPTKEASPLWKQNPKATDRYSAGLGYEYADVISADIQYPKSYYTSDYQYFKMFIGIDRALWAGIVRPEELTNEPITRAQFALLLARALKLPLGAVDYSQLPWDLKDPKWQDYLPSIQALLSCGFMKLLPDESFYPEGNMTREEVIRTLYAIKENNPASVPFPTITPTRTYITLDFPVQSPFFFKDGQRVPMDITPIIVENRTFLPIRYVAEALGAQVEWNQEEQRVSITSTAPYIKVGGSITTTTATTIELWIGKPVARVNGTDVPIDPSNPSVVPFVLPPGRTMLPLRFISESLGAKVYWLQEIEEVLVIWEPPAPIKEQTLPPP